MPREFRLPDLGSGLKEVRASIASLESTEAEAAIQEVDRQLLAAVFERAGRPDIDERATAAQFGKGLVQAASKLSHQTGMARQRLGGPAVHLAQAMVHRMRGGVVYLLTKN